MIITLVYSYLYWIHPDFLWRYFARYNYLPLQFTLQNLDIHRDPLADHELADELENELDERRGLLFAKFSLIASTLKKLPPWRS